MSNYVKCRMLSRDYRIERCPDKDSTIEIAIKSNKIGDIPSFHTFDNIPLIRSQTFLPLNQETHPIRRSIAINNPTKKEDLQETKTSNDLSPTLNCEITTNPGRVSIVLTEDRGCRLSFSQLRESVNRLSLNSQEMRT